MREGMARAYIEAEMKCFKLMDSKHMGLSPILNTVVPQAKFRREQAL